jgi:hypothetical protein
LGQRKTSARRMKKPNPRIMFRERRMRLINGSQRR